MITSNQASKLEVKSHSQISPYLEACCLRISASISDERTTEEVEYLTGVNISKSAQQRLIHRQDFDLPQAESIVSELSVDGGNIRVRTPEGEPSSWKGYKATVLHEQGAIAASFQENEVIISWVNSQELAPVVTCLGDGHDGVWNIIKELVPTGEKREILDWFHLMENLHKIGGSNQRLFAARSLLWYGKVDETIKLFDDCNLKQAENFCIYLEVIVPCQINPIGLSQNQTMGEERFDWWELQVVEVKELTKVRLNPIDKPDKIRSKNRAANDFVLLKKS